jgi:ribosome-binding protein aMBF1 (putative translation factor)
MTAKEFLDLSTKLFSDMKAWIAEAGKAADLSPSDLAMLNASMKIIERVTLKEAERKPDTAN